jgi:hypothetical protein
VTILAGTYDQEHPGRNAGELLRDHIVPAVR